MLAPRARGVMFVLAATVTSRVSSPRGGCSNHNIWSREQDRETDISSPINLRISQMRPSNTRYITLNSAHLARKRGQVWQ